MSVTEILDQAQQLLTNIGAMAAIQAGLFVIVAFIFIREFRNR